VKVLLAVERLPDLGANDHLPAGSSPLTLTLAVRRRRSWQLHAQPFLVDVRDSLVGPRKTIPRFVDLALGETLDHEQVPYGFARLAQFAVGRYERATIDHEVSLLIQLAGSSQDRELV